MFMGELHCMNRIGKGVWGRGMVIGLALGIELKLGVFIARIGWTWDNG